MRGPFIETQMRRWLSGLSRDRAAATGDPPPSAVVHACQVAECAGTAPESTATWLPAAFSLSAIWVMAAPGRAQSSALFARGFLVRPGL